MSERRPKRDKRRNLQLGARHVEVLDDAYANARIVGGAWLSNRPKHPRGVIKLFDPKEPFNGIR
jgi:hypothetical protein